MKHLRTFVSAFNLMQCAFYILLLGITGVSKIRQVMVAGTDGSETTWGGFVAVIVLLGLGLVAGMNNRRVFRPAAPALRGDATFFMLNMVACLVAAFFSLDVFKSPGQPWFAGFDVLMLVPYAGGSVAAMVAAVLARQAKQ